MNRRLKCVKVCLPAVTTRVKLGTKARLRTQVNHRLALGRTAATEAEEYGQCCGARGAADPEGVKLELGRLVRRERRAWRVPTGAIGSAQTGHELSVCAWAWDAPRHHHVKISPVRISDSGSLLRGRERERGWPPLRTLVCVKEANWAGTRLRPAHVRASVSPSCAGRTLSCAAGKWRAARGVRSAGDA